MRYDTKVVQVILGTKCNTVPGKNQSEYQNLVAAATCIQGKRNLMRLNKVLNLEILLGKLLGRARSAMIAMRSRNHIPFI